MRSSQFSVEISIQARGQWPLRLFVFRFLQRERGPQIPVTVISRVYKNHIFSGDECPVYLLSQDPFKAKQFVRKRERNSSSP